MGLIQISEGRAHRGQGGSRVTLRPEQQGIVKQLRLVGRKVDITWVNPRQVRGSNVLRHADNFIFRPVAAEVEVQLKFLSDRIFALPELPRRQSADDCHGCARITLGSSKVPASQNWNSQGGEITRRDVVREHLPGESSWRGFRSLNTDRRRPRS